MSKNMDLLKQLGFKEAGEWFINDDGKLAVKFSSTKLRASTKVIYAFVQDGEVFYIGVSDNRLDTRMSGYRYPGKTQKTNIRVHQHLKELIEKTGKPVKIYALASNAIDLKYEGVPVNVAAGLEGELIQRLRPKWNDQKKI